MKQVRFLLMALLGFALASCEPVQKEFFLKDLQGLWVENGTQVFSRYTTESADNVKSGYLWGRSWDEADDVHEEDLVPYGNGWFMYRLVDNELLKIEQMDGKWADIPKRYTLTLLNETEMTYYPNGYPKEKAYFTKQLK